MWPFSLDYAGRWNGSCVAMPNKVSMDPFATLSLSFSFFFFFLCLMDPLFFLLFPFLAVFFPSLSLFLRHLLSIPLFQPQSFFPLSPSVC